MKGLILVIFAFIAVAFSARAQSYTFNPAADSFVSSANPTDNYGAAGALEVSATGSPNGEFTSVMQFNLGTLGSVAGLAVQSITLQLTAASPNNAIFNTSTSGLFSVIWMQNNTWTEGTGSPSSPSLSGITYNNLPSYLGGSDEALGTFSFSGTTSGNNSYTLQLPAGFLTAVTSGSNVSLEIVPSDTSVSYLFNSRSFGTALSRPLLTVVAVPEPAGIVFVGVGLLVLAGCRRFWQPRA